MTLHLRVHKRHHRLVLHVRCALEQNYPYLHLRVRYPLTYLGAFKERYTQYVAVTLGFQIAEESSEISVPSDAETIVPAAENGVSRFELEVCFAQGGAETGGADVADVVGEVWVQAADFQGDIERF